MRHKCKCPICGEMKYLHAREIPSGGAFVPSIEWLCDECDALTRTPFHDSIKEDEE